MAEACAEGGSDYNSGSEDKGEVDVHLLRPKELFKIKVNIGGQDVLALVDTGASKSIVKVKFSNKVCLDRDISKNMTGIGGEPLRVIGSDVLDMKIGGIEFNWECKVVEDNSIGYDMILGHDFIRYHKAKIDLKRRKIALQRSDNTRVRLNIGHEGEVSRRMIENLPVFCKEDVNVKVNYMTKVPVEFDVGDRQLEDKGMMYYEGKDGRVESLSGVMSDSGENFVWVQKLHKRRTIKKGEILGHVNTMIVMEDGGEIDPDDWSAERINKEVKLGGNLDEEEKEKVKKLLLDWKVALSKGDADIGKADVDPHSIDVTQCTPIWQKRREFSQPINDEIERQCTELLASDILDYSNSNWSSPLVPVTKSDGSLRMCVDYRQVNKVTRKEEYPMPNLNKCVYRPSKVKYFTKLDLVRGYYQVPIEKSSRKYTAFSTMQHHYEFKRLSFGLKNSGMAFQRIMQQILSPLLHNNIIIYIDDILVMSETFEEHAELVGKVLSLLASYRIKVKVSKCEWFREEVVFLGHVISSKGIRKSPEFVEKVMKVEKPETVKQLRKFVGLINFQRKFIKDCSLLTKPLTECLNGKGSKKITWSTEMEQAYLKLKEDIAKDVMLTYPDYSEGASRMELYVDASGTGCGACLLQKQQGVPKVIAYASMSFSNTERRYSATDREMSAIRWGVNNFRCFLGGVPFILVTDHKPLVYLNAMSSSNSRLMRTVEELAEFEFEIRYRPGKDNEAADFLSRSNELEIESNNDMNDYKYLPPGIQRICEVPGGGNSLFESLLIVMKEGQEFYGYQGDLPEDHQEIRETLVEELSKNGKEYGITNGKQVRQRLRLMKRTGQLPMVEILLAASKRYKIKIHVYCGMKSPVVFAYDDNKDRFIMRLECVSMIHYNPLCEKGNLVEEIDESYVNMVMGEDYEKDDEKRSEADLEDLELDLHVDELLCRHTAYHTSVDISGLDQKGICALFDTGAQVSLVSEAVLNNLRDNGLQPEVHTNKSKLIAVTQTRQSINGYVELELVIKGVGCVRWPFAIVDTQVMPTCFLLGANFIEANDIELDLGNGKVIFKGKGGEQFVINSAFIGDDSMHRFEWGICCGLATVNRESDCETEMSDESMSEEFVVPKYMVSNLELINMQKRNYAINQLRGKIEKQLAPKDWNIKALNQFKKSAGQIRFEGGLLVRGLDNRAPVIVSMPYMVDIVSKTHTSLNHVGRHKLVGAIKPFFWHPGLDSLCLDYCKSCAHCQKAKSRRMDKMPPVKKICTSRPFEMVCVDLLKYPRSRRGNEYMLVCIDHFSKWLAVQPIKDKCSLTVANALKRNILPSLPRIPERMLSDHGAEFVGRDYQGVLEEMSITHCMSSPYFAPGNGCAERVNRTIIQLLKGDEGVWDEKLYKMIINYNNSVHSETKMTPSQCLLVNKHEVRQRFPVDAEVIRNWREGNPKFCSFKVGQKVVKKIHRIGTLLVHKLQDRYDGPFVVRKIHSNGLSYEISKEDDEDSRLKVNHRHLRAWHEVPHYIDKHLRNRAEKDQSNRDQKKEQSTHSCTDETMETDETFDYNSSSSSDSSSESNSTESEAGMRKPRLPKGQVCLENVRILTDYQKERSVKGMNDWNSKCGRSENESTNDRKVGKNVTWLPDDNLVRDTGSKFSSDKESDSSALGVEDLDMLVNEINRTHVLMGRMMSELEVAQNRVGLLEQRLSGCNDLAQELLNQTWNRGTKAVMSEEFSSVSSFEPNEYLNVIHSTPIRNRTTLVPNMSGINQDCTVSDGRRSLAFEGEEVDSEFLGTQSTSTEFSGFVIPEENLFQSDRTVKHIYGIIDRIQNQIQDVGRRDSGIKSNVGQQNNGLTTGLGEKQLQNSLTGVLRRSTRQRRKPDWYGIN